MARRTTRGLFDDPPPGRTMTVDELAQQVKRAIEAAPSLSNVSVRGEIQNFKIHTSGHVYFYLLGSDARVACVMFRSQAEHVITWPRDGDEVVVSGSVSSFPKTGNYQIYASRIMAVGLGAQARAKEELTRRLEREGLFDPRHKRPIPPCPKKVAVITSPTGAAVQDIIKVSEKRAPFIDIVVVPTLVQGVDAPPSIARALALAGTVPGVDCAILARGGGAQGDLAPFDDEIVVRAIRSCPLPVVSGIGHQTDSTISDLAADAAMPTPSAAAERVFPDASELRASLEACEAYMGRCVASKIELCYERTSRSFERLTTMISRELDDAASDLDGLDAAITRNMDLVIQKNDEALTHAAARLDSLSPLAVLARGYAHCSRDGADIRRAAEISHGDTLRLRFVDGSVDAEAK